ncbi:acyl-CoA carboxylase subunit epsilon [Streptomyces sp. NPDC050743]|uniref:acyl-CoA carboxylase subunit epsilon n=1 Tax=Streptomyces sp. NPDC050743 TaxID=3365634 RepID=UPI0037982BE9
MTGVAETQAGAATGTGSLLDAAGAVRVEKGTPTEEELAALIAVLLSCSAGAAAEEDVSPAPPRWRRPEQAADHRTPRSWRAARALWS